MQNLWIASRYVSCMLYFGSLLLAACMDAKFGEIPDICHAQLLVSGLLGIFTKTVAASDAVAGLLAIGSLCLILSLWKDGLGGGDVKLIGAAGFCVGIRISAYAVVLSFLGAIVYIQIRKTIQKEKGEAVALAPFLSAGYCLLYFQ